MHATRVMTRAGALVASRPSLSDSTRPRISCADRAPVVSTLFDCSDVPRPPFLAYFTSCCSRQLCSGRQNVTTRIARARFHRRLDGRRCLEVLRLHYLGHRRFGVFSLFIGRQRGPPPQSHQRFLSFLLSARSSSLVVVVELVVTLTNARRQTK